MVLCKVFFSASGKFCHGGVKHIGGGIDGCLTGILDNAHDKADAYYLHGDIVGDPEEAAGQRDKQKRSSCHTGCAPGADG